MKHLAINGRNSPGGPARVFAGDGEMNRRMSDRENA